MPLTGAELLKFVDKNEGLGRISLARGAGYLRTNKKGEEVPDVTKFYNALFDAQGLKMASRRGFRGGPSKSYETTVHANGVMVIGRSYTEEAELQPGDVFKIKTSPGKLSLELVSA